MTYPPPRKPISIPLPYSVDISFLETLGVRRSSCNAVKFRCESAIEAIKNGRLGEARRLMERAAAIDDRVADFWLIMAALARTTEEQIEHLEHALAYAPDNMTAIKTLAILRGELPPDDAPPPPPQTEPGEVEFETIMCPQCQGRLQYQVDARDVRCHFCDFQVLDEAGLPRTAATNQTVLAIGLLKRESRPQEWNIGQRWLHCNNCGATTTLTPQTLTSTCRFCDSRHIVQQGVHSHFEQPDIILPFNLDEDAARAAIAYKLRSGIRIITRFFADPIKHIRLNGVFLPFWIFEGDMEVRWSGPGTGTYPVLLHDVPYFAAQTPARRLVEDIDRYDLRHAVDYEPRLLATFPAELYSIDIDRASINVRSRLSNIAMAKFRTTQIQLIINENLYGERESTSLSNLHTVTRFLSYRLALLPVWIGVLVEEDGDTRQLLVNGQNGLTVLGRLQKA